MPWKASKIDHVHDSEHLPPGNVFGQSLYTFDIGQNDFTSELGSLGIGAVKQYLPQVASQIAWTIKVKQEAAVICVPQEADSLAISVLCRRSMTSEGGRSWCSTSPPLDVTQLF